MSKLFYKSLLLSPIVLGAALVASGSAIAAETNKISEESAQPQAAALQPQVIAATPEAPKAEASPVFSNNVVAEQPAVAPGGSSLEQINRYSREGRSTNQMGQVTSVSQLSDVKPTDWAFQALQSLVERYGCIAGYPDKTYRGNRAMSRYEFAAGLNACLDRVNQLIEAATADLVKKEDLEILKKLQEEFAAELATLRGRVDALEARTTTLEKQQFSTTTKLAGEAIFAVTDEFAQRTNNETVFQDRVRLVLNTSFSGKDLLVTRLSAGNARPFTQPGFEGTQTFNFGASAGFNNSVSVDWLAYYFPLGEKGQVYIPAYAGLHYDYAPTNAGLMDAFDSGNGPLSYFAQRNPIYDIGGGSGLAFNYKLTNAFTISGGYLADNSNTGSLGANNPAQGNGLFNGSYSALAQLSFNTDKFSVGLTYVNAFRKGPGAVFDGGGGVPALGSGQGPLGIIGGLAGPNGAAVNAYGVSGAFKLNPKISINAFGMYADVDLLRDIRGKANVWSFGGGVAFADFGKKGNLLGLFAGVQPYVGNNRTFGIADNDLPIHLEGFYKYQLNDNISITPGLIWVINPGQVGSNKDVVIGTIRTTFTF